MSSIDYNVNNYTIDELLAVLDLTDLDETSIMDATDVYIDRFQSEDNEKLSIFFQNIQTKLLQYTNKLNKGDNPPQFEPNNKQTNEWYKYEALPQKDQVQKDKITDRFQKIDVYDNDHVPMNRDHLGVNNVFDTKVAQDILNPNLENVTTRFINLDSQFRQASGGIDSVSTDYTLDLSDPLTNVLSLRLYSIQIPFTWYAIDNQYGNTCFWVTNQTNYFQISIAPGNYTPSEFVLQLNTSFQTAAFTGPFTDTSPVSYNTFNGKITIQLEEYTDPSGNAINGIVENTAFNPLINPFFTFFDFTGERVCQVNCISQNLAFNNTLGWVMGFRLPITPVVNTGNTPVAVLDLYGTKYLILVLDDYNQNHINNGLITITELSNKLALPSYYIPTLPVSCPPVGNTLLSQFSSTNNTLSGINPTNVGNLLQDKLSISYTKTPRVLPTAPRLLTQAQIYTINEIIKNRGNNTSYRGKAPTSSDTFALIPIKHTGMKTGEMYIDFSGGLQDNKRIYFGPVDIDRMHIRLLDDRGFTIDLHGSEWCITLISDNLYQY